MFELVRDVHVELLQFMGGDAEVIRAAKISTGRDQYSKRSANSEDEGFINFLMKNRHGSPFEHGSMTFRIEAPIFTAREFFRHRIGWSYNEESGRYTQLAPRFYVPDLGRPLIQTGKPGAYTFVAGTEEQAVVTQDTIRRASMEAYHHYSMLLDDGVAREVARMVLPVNIMTSFYATCNPRSLMHFLSLRTIDPTSKFPSFPQYEIELVARQMERAFDSFWPITFKTFKANGRVAP